MPAGTQAHGMLISPERVHRHLQATLADRNGPHTAVLTAPQGQILGSASVAPNSDSKDSYTDDPGHEMNDNEPWLETPERLRLLVGLASQWHTDESPRVECELGRLLMMPIALPDPEVPPQNAAVPVMRSRTPSSMLLVLNSTSSVSWSDLVVKAEAFSSVWRRG
ncbi:hypothetical protein BCR39DRAFT_519597 [Naematelia encephala]|uniref:Roadblock/LAMTOR2 domain-containing protein n=1 Tax=Naematelia encephala TaxID=71784 RepID=A0A1Y2BFP5_9TREE|nr:hypothetical protein BCR39DRAFT_519597 [Naematelia encephala]